jgi:hypothetical protein
LSKVKQNREQRDNHIVECVLAGKPEAIDPIAKKNFLRELGDPDGWGAPHGTLVPFRAIPKPDAGALGSANRYPGSAEAIAAARVFSPDRQTAISEERAVATRDECMAFRLAWIEAIMEDPCLLDFDDCPGWHQFEVAHSDGRTAIAVVFVSGYCFTFISRRLAGFFADSAALSEWLDSRGLALRG